MPEKDKKYELEVQTRNEGGEIKYFSTLTEAKQHAEEDPTVWKISFSLPTGERVRLVKRNGAEIDFWVYEPLMPIVMEAIGTLVG